MVLERTLNLCHEILGGVIHASKLFHDGPFPINDTREESMVDDSFHRGLVVRAIRRDHHENFPRCARQKLPAGEICLIALRVGGKDLRRISTGINRDGEQYHLFPKTVTELLLELGKFER